MAAYQITCINKPHHFSPHEHITHIGSTAGNWRLTLASTINRIRNGTDSFYTIDASRGRQVDIAVVGEAGKQPFLRTHADGKWKQTIALHKTCLAELCEKHGTTPAAFRQPTARYSGHRHIVATEADGVDRHSSREFVGTPARRQRVLDQLGRVRARSKLSHGQ
jgi:hypothetical protein